MQDSTRILIPGLDLNSSLQAVKLAESHPNLFAAIGLHPGDSLKWDAQTIPALRELSINQKVVAMGEIGLDYYWDTAPHDHQQLVLQEQLGLANELQLPVVIHLREKEDAAYGDCARDMIQILDVWTRQLRKDINPLFDRPGVLHSFSGTTQTAEKAISMNFLIGVTGPVTYKNALDRQMLVSSLPIEKDAY